MKHLVRGIVNRAYATGLLLLAALASSCTDPVRDRAIERLGEEDPAVPAGPLHRGGQPCLLCHSEGGPASNKAFAVAGTIYETDAPGSGPAKGVEVRFVDSLKGEPFGVFKTNAAGNFWVFDYQWPDLAYPFKVGIRRPQAGGEDLTQPMSTTVNREGSCNFCHDPKPAEPRSAITPIFIRKAKP